MLSPWKDVPVWKNAKLSVIHEWYIKSVNKIPRGATIWLSGLLQAFGRLWTNKLRG